jgi:ssDNA-binding Zn-finger/Zn-ribbon topoisomerase 1
MPYTCPTCRFETYSRLGAAQGCPSCGARLEDRRLFRSIPLSAVRAQAKKVKGATSSASERPNVRPDSAVT